MAFVFDRGLTIPLWAAAFCAVALASPTGQAPPLMALLGIAVIAFTMMAIGQRRLTSRQPVTVLPAAKARDVLRHRSESASRCAE